MTQKIKYSPMLKIAMEEIKLILKKYDIAGAVYLHTPGYGEFLLDLAPSYSCLIVSDAGFRFKALEADYGVIGRHQFMVDTSNMIIHLNEMMLPHHIALLELEKILRQRLDIADLNG